MTCKMETLKELKKDFNDAMNHLDDDTINSDKHSTIKTTISYLVKWISEYVDKNNETQAPSPQFFNLTMTTGTTPTSIGTQVANAPAPVSTALNVTTNVVSSTTGIANTLNTLTPFSHC